ncbi:MAG: type IV secretion system protein [Rickettsiales bacterium]|nr:type IV secretion system protein [Rickettsiales bacterium]
MPLSSAFHKLLRQLLCCVLMLSAVFAPSQAYAIYEGVRSDTVYRDNHMCNGNNLKFDPFTENKDLNWEITNPVCAGFIGGVGALLVGAGQVMDGIGYGKFKTPGTCTPTNDYGKPKKASEEKAVRFSPTSPMLIATSQQALYRYSGLCGSRGAELATASAANTISCTPPATANCPYTTAQTALASRDTAMCCSSYASYVAIFNTAVATLAGTWGLAKGTYENARICGHDWNEWKSDPETGLRIKDKGPYQICLKQLFEGNGKIGSNCAAVLSKASDGGLSGVVDRYVQGSFNCLGKAFSAGAVPDSSCLGENNFPSKVSLTNKYYREYIYGGVEFEDNGDGACSNPWASDQEKRQEYLGYTSENQRYYMTGGGGSAPVYACHRFLSGGVTPETQGAYDCCRAKSQKSICIQHRDFIGTTMGKYNHKFCSAGTFCDVSDITFEVYESKVEQNYICAKTYSVCPYNHLLGGGTEKKEIDRNGNVTNYCQYMNHCSKLPIVPYIYSSNLSGAWISGACRDLKGDSQNVYGFSTQVVPTNTRHFSAPMAQCFKESMENILLNKAGATRCVSASERPNPNGECSTGYVYKEGDQLAGDSFFIKIQKNLKLAIKMGLIVSIIAFGYMILLGVPKVDSFNKKALMTYLVKLCLVMFFAVGDGWQSGFMDGVIGFSGAMSELSFRLDESGDPDSLDGCQFPKINYADSNSATKYDNPAYPPGKEYLRVWDTLDCKLARAIGYGPEVSVPNLLFMILGGFLDFGAGILFVLGSLFLAFVMFMIVVRALHVFLLATTAIILLIYVSPITITCAMFARTKGIFDGWRKQLMGISLQPMILFAYLGVFIAIFDHVIVGEVRFSGDGKNVPKKIICDNSSIGDVLIANPSVNGKHTSSGNSTSIYCIFRTAEIDTFSGLEPIGIGLPVLMSMNKEKVMTIIRGALVMFVFLQFLDIIPRIAGELVGGATIKSNFGSVEGFAKSLGGALKSLQDRGKGAAKKLGGAALRKGGEVAGGAMGAIRKLGSKGKSVSGGGGGGGNGGDHSAKSDTGVGDHSAESGSVGGDRSAKSDSVGGDRSAKSGGGGADHSNDK